MTRDRKYTATMTKEQLATIRREMAAYIFDTSEYLDLDTVAAWAARKRRANPPSRK